MMQNSTHATNVIKGNGSVKSTLRKKNVIKNQVLRARAEAEKIVNQAEQYAQKLRETAEVQSANRLKEAFSQGTEEALLEFEQNLLASKEIRDKVLRDVEKDVLKLAVRLAEKIIGKELDENDKTVNDIVSTALQNARQKERVTIRVNPADLTAVQSNGEKFKASAQAKFIDFAADPRVERGGCLIESEVGTVDARLETQFRVLKRALLAQADGEFILESE